MAQSTNQKKCFIIMPITTPISHVERYKDDSDHFVHALDHFFIPALEEAGFEPIPPIAEGSNIIHADIIKQLSDCELVLCDMSILNPNVFFEFGIRAALDKPVALVVDDKTSPIPFDAGIINFHQYDSSLFPWTLEKQKKELTKHVKNAYKKSEGKNALWKYFGVSQTGTFKPEEAELGDKIDVIMKQLSALERQQILQKDMIVSNVSKYNNDTIPVKPEVFLTLIEKKILEMVLDGKSNSEIADLINRSKRTVEAHRSHIMQKLNLSPKTNLKELYIRAVRLGLVEF